MAESPKGRPALRLRRLFFAAATALAACCLMLPGLAAPLPDSAARTDPDSQPPSDAGWQPGGRDHRRLLVVDSVIAFTDGAEISRIRARPEGPPVAAEPKMARRELYIALLLAIANARQRVWLTYGYFVPDGRMLDALQRAAQRGVDVRLVLPGRDDSWMSFYAGRARYGRLLGAGVRIFERRDAPLRTRTASADGIWTSFSQPAISGSDLMVFDRTLARQLEQLFQLDEAASHEVRLAEWEKRGLASRFKEWLARCCERLF